MKNKQSEPIRDARPGDYPAIVALNRAEERWTSPMETADFEELAALADYFRVIESGGRITGFLLAMRESAAYDNVNFDWFRSRYDRFVYVDRIVIDSGHAGKGLGRRFYEHLFGHARSNDAQRVVCEYTFEPLNEVSQRFHASLGFIEVGRQVLHNRGKTVSMQCRELAVGD